MRPICADAASHQLKAGIDLRYYGACLREQAMLASRLKSHIKHARDQIVGRVKIGPRKYRIRGYLPSHLAVRTEWEPHVSLAISAILQKRKGVFIDIGANVGQTLFTVLRADPDRSYLGFEPQIACCHYLQQFIQDNGLMGADFSRGPFIGKRFFLAFLEQSVRRLRDLDVRRASAEQHPIGVRQKRRRGIGGAWRIRDFRDQD